MLHNNSTLTRQIKRLLAISLAATISVSALAAAPPKAEIEQALHSAMEEFNVLGMSVSVVYDGEVYFADGSGIAEIKQKQQVDQNSLYQIASVSKAFTAEALAILVDEGKLNWDDPVIDHISEFRMYDPWVTREFTIKDLLTHRSGLPLGAGDLLLFPRGNTDISEIIRAMRFLKPSSSFRSEYAYDNLFYIIAGEVISRVANISFDEFLEQRLLFPLGMTDCRANLSRLATGAPAASPHLYIEEQHQTTISHENPLGAAAGGVNCSAKSMALWMQFLLNNGINQSGKQLLSAERITELFSPVTLNQPRQYMVENAGSFLNAYALGWNVTTFYGEPMYSHGGGLWGMTSYIAILPEQGIGIFASNNLMSSAPLALVNNLLDKFLSQQNQAAGKDWTTIINNVLSARNSSAKEVVAKAEASRDADSTPSLALKAYVGTYTDDWYGDISIALGKSGELIFSSARSAGLRGTLEHFQHDTFIARWDDRGLNADAYVSFSLNPEGEATRIAMKAVSPSTDFSFDFHDLDLVRVSRN
jgi:CubicO group peptidase (beta-lactamase class C family)